MARKRSRPGSKVDFDVMLMDVQMPVMDGFQATAAIRKEEERYRATPAHHRADRPRHGGRSREVPGGRHGCLPGQAAASQEAGRAGRKRGGPETVSGVTATTSRPTAATAGDFDLNFALESLDNDPDLLVSQMGFFLHDTPVLLADIAQAINQSDAYQLQLAAHRLKGMLVAVCLPRCRGTGSGVGAEGQSRRVGRCGRVTREPSPHGPSTDRGDRAIRATAPVTACPDPKATADVLCLRASCEQEVTERTETRPCSLFPPVRHSANAVSSWKVSDMKTSWPVCRRIGARLPSTIAPPPAGPCTRSTRSRYWQTCCSGSLE